MTDPRQIAAGIVGAVDWQTEVSGFCRCPGEALHTHHNGKKDCRVSVDGAPTIYCFHSSFALVVAEACRTLRRAIGQSPWTITLSGGRVLWNGDVLQKDGTVLLREVVQIWWYAHAEVAGVSFRAATAPPMNPRRCQTSARPEWCAKLEIRIRISRPGQGG